MPDDDRAELDRWAATYRDAAYDGLAGLLALMLRDLEVAFDNISRVHDSAFKGPVAIYPAAVPLGLAIRMTNNAVVWLLDLQRTIAAPQQIVGDGDAADRHERGR